MKYCFFLLCVFGIPLQSFVSAFSPAHHGVVEFFDRIEEGDTESAKIALIKAVHFCGVSPKQVKSLFQLFVAEMNQRYHYTLTPRQVLKLTMHHLALDPVACEYLPYLNPLLKLTAGYNREGPPTIEEGDGPELAVDMVVGVVECFAGALCFMIPHPFVKFTVSGYLVMDGATRIFGAMPEQDEINKKWQSEQQKKVE